MRCGRGHDHASIAEVRACYGLPADKGRQENLVPAGPCEHGHLTKEQIEEGKRREAATPAYRVVQDVKGVFTSACPACVAGMHTRADRLEIPNANFSGHSGPHQNAQPISRVNRYAGNCTLCGGYVPSEAGVLHGNKETGYTITHLPDKCVAMSEPPGDGNGNLSQRKGSLPYVPEGHYAIASATGNNDLDFFRVDRPTEGDYAGRTFVKRVIGGKPDANIRRSEYRAVLQRILDAGPEQAATLYGQALGQCWRCNRHLTDELSRKLGIGPDCRSRM
jgi:Family of unknown function (DUF6011)